MQKYRTEWIYLKNSNNTARFILGEKADNMVACIGINPSTAKPYALDNTLKSVKRIAQFNGFSGWLMYNVYPQRATDPNELDSEVKHDLILANSDYLRQSIQNFEVDTIWLAYGDLIESRKYLPRCMLDLFLNLNHSNLNWKIIGTPTKKGHPRHPLYKKTKSKFVDFDMANYVENVLKPLMTDTSNSESYRNF